MIDEKLLTFIPKMYFPKSIFYGNKSTAFFRSIANNSKFFVISKSFHEKNPELSASLLSGSDYLTHTGEPRLQDIEKIKNKISEKKYDFIVAVGGGAVIDLVKVIKKDLQIPLVAVPTTIGSGSEVSQYSVIIDEENKVKKIFNSVDLLPEVVIFNHEYLSSLDQRTIITQSVDGLAHGLESLVSKMANTFSDMFALVSIQNLYEHLTELAEHGISPELLEKLKIDTTIAGLAQSSAATGLAHSFAHYLGPKIHISHAELISTFLLDVVELNAKNSDKYQKLDSLNELNSKNFISKLTQLFEKLKLKNRKITLPEEIEAAAEKIRRDICTMSNTYSPKVEDIIPILKKHL